MTEINGAKGQHFFISNRSKSPVVFGFRLILLRQQKRSCCQFPLASDNDVLGGVPFLGQTSCFRQRLSGWTSIILSMVDGSNFVKVAQ
jgi:hypothetical protein